MGSLCSLPKFLSPLLLFVTSCTSIPRIQAIDRSQMQLYIREFGYQNDIIDNYWQDITGHVLYVPDGDLLKGYSVLLLTADRKIPKRVNLPSNNPLKTYWVNPQGQIRYLPDYAYPEQDRSVGTTVDNQSGFFFQVTNDKVVHVGRMEHSDSWIFSVRETDQFIVNQICAKDKIVYLLDHRDRSDPIFGFSKKNCWAFAPDSKRSEKYIEVDQFSVPGTVRVVDPFLPRFVCDGYGYMPFPGHPFLYDVEEHKIIRALPSDQLIVFLDGDWLTSRLKNGGK